MRMNLASLTSADLRYISTLLERKEKLTEAIQKIDFELASFESGRRPGKSSRSGMTSSQMETSEIVPASEPSDGGLGGNRTRRGQLKEAILGALRDAGREGISIQELATRVNSKPLNVSAWLAATGKKLGTVEKAERGVYRLKG